ncbi:sugar transferase [Thiocystis violacea]|uniref:sugar transferase n=1 Tax=Thiocystis violacea TaxID=13725 RepID=UPI00190539B2|nr:sugar transferase [Thiocystis violacea]MBK1719477.1 hypothetical protein [Thiocystis violacea]
MWADIILSEVLDRESTKARMRDYKGTLPLIHRFADVLIILASLWLAALLTGAGASVPIITAGLIGVVLFNLVADAKNLYRPWRTESIRAEIGATTEAWLGVTGISLVAVYVQQDAIGYPPMTLLSWFLIALVALNAWRFAVRRSLRWARARGYNRQRLAIAGSGELAKHVARTASDNTWMGFSILGLFDDGDRDAALPLVSSRTRGSLDRLVQLARAGELDVVYIALPPGRAERRINTLVRQLADSTTSVYLVQDRRSRAPDGEQGSRQILPDLGRVDVLHRRCVDVNGLKIVSVYESPFQGPSAWLKRLEDLAVGSVALLLLALPMLAIAIGVKLSGPGPAIFMQRRYGLDGKEITVWKFRTMRVCEDGGRVIQARKGDSRVTPFGEFLRRTSLDELPQFINVVQGSMSIVGPRPHAVAHNEHYRGLIGGYMLRHKVKPGITGWAQVNGWRGETESIDKMGRRVDFDLDYIRNWSVWLDIRIILLTFLHGFSHRNAY